MCTWHFKHILDNIYNSFNFNENISKITFIVKWDIAVNNFINYYVCLFVKLNMVCVPNVIKKVVVHLYF